MELSDVEDRGVQTGAVQPWFCLSSHFVDEIWSAVDRLQRFLLSFSALAGWESVFIIDPHDHFKQILAVAPQLAHLNATWKMLRARISWVTAIFEKYDLEYQGIPANSPATTNPELYNPQPMLALDTLGSHLMEMMRNISYMAEAASEWQRRRIAKGRGFEEVWRELDQLMAAFPPCNLELGLRVISYDLVGNMISRPWSPFFHSQSAVETEERHTLLLELEDARLGEHPHQGSEDGTIILDNHQKGSDKWV